MYCSSLQCQHFRNLTDVALIFGPATTLLLGDNGQGKTNLLEGLWLLSRGRSHRTNQDRELIQWSEPLANHPVSEPATQSYLETPITPTIAMVSATFQPDNNSPASIGDATTTITAQFWVENNRLRSRWQVNGVALASRAKLVGLVPTVGFFSPDLSLLRGSPSDRRRWLDGAIVQHQPGMMAAFQRFEALRKQKAELLKQWGGRFSPAQLEELVTWNQTFAEAAATVITARQSYLNQLLPIAQHQYAAIAEGAEILHYQYAEGGYDGMDSATIFNRLLELLTAQQRDEIARQRCLIGPHREDIQLTLDERDATAYASQGQQRSLVIALKLAEVDQLAQARQTRPILLLDDVMAELDPHRQAYLLGQLGGQVVMTTTHIPETGPLAGMGASVPAYSVNKGQVSKKAAVGQSTSGMPTHQAVSDLESNKEPTYVS